MYFTTAIAAVSSITGRNGPCVCAVRMLKWGERTDVVELNASIAEKLLIWYAQNKRPLPWRRDRAPYHVWVSEIMCQQTRVEAVKAYYLRFLDALPGIEDLAACPEEQLHKLWEGLGYYSRAGNLKKAAELIVHQHGGIFPSDYAGIRRLPGVGDYTAAAVASISFGLPCPAVDGNVLRVVTRLTASELDVSRESTKARVREVLRPMFEGLPAGELNQAFMELGALVCRPNHAPDCDICPLREGCRSSGGLWQRIPVKSAKKARREEVRTVFLLTYKGAWALSRRQETGLLAGLWEFPNLPGELAVQAVLDTVSAWGCRPQRILRQTERQHVFTHLEWKLPACAVECAEQAGPFTWVTPAEIRAHYSLPTAFRQFLDILEDDLEGD